MNIYLFQFIICSNNNNKNKINYILELTYANCKNIAQLKIQRMALAQNLNINPFNAFTSVLRSLHLISKFINFFLILIQNRIFCHQKGCVYLCRFESDYLAINFFCLIKLSINNYVFSKFISLFCIKNINLKLRFKKLFYIIFLFFQIVLVLIIM